MTDRNTYDDFAEQYSAMVSDVGFSSDPVQSVFLDVVGDVQWLRVLDAGYGDGPVARLLASRGAEVCAVDNTQRRPSMGPDESFRREEVTLIWDFWIPLPSATNTLMH